jgi:hypothetical protein
MALKIIDGTDWPPHLRSPIGKVEPIIVVGLDICIIIIYVLTSRKLVRCTGKLLKIKSKLIFIPFTSFVDFFFFFFCSKCCRQDR